MKNTHGEDDGFCFCFFFLYIPTVAVYVSTRCRDERRRRRRRRRRAGGRVNSRTTTRAVGDNVPVVPSRRPWRFPISVRPARAFSSPDGLSAVALRSVSRERRPVRDDMSDTDSVRTDRSQSDLQQKYDKLAMEFAKVTFDSVKIDIRSVPTIIARREYLPWFPIYLTSMKFTVSTVNLCALQILLSFFTVINCNIIDSSEPVHLLPVI